MATGKRDLFFLLLTSPRLRLLRHALVWLVLLSPALVGNGERKYAGHYDLYEGFFLFAELIGCIYLNIYVLVPRTVFKGRYTLYLLSVVALACCTALALYLYSGAVSWPHKLVTESQPPLGTILLLGIIFVIPLLLPFTAVKVLQQWVMDAGRINELEKRYLESELEALRNQINPHFLFNMLNSVNVLTRKDPKQASELVLKLSDFLRYHLYETGHKEVLLSAELKHVSDFLNLEAVRRQQFTFNVQHDLPAASGLKVPPNVFSTLIENAIKYSADPEHASYIRIVFSTGQRQLTVSVENSKGPATQVAMQGGVGLSNVRRRLELMYGDNFSLLTQDAKDSFKAILTIPI